MTQVLQVGMNDVPNGQQLQKAPRLPIPPLRQSLDAYLESLEPFIDEVAKKSTRSKTVLLAERRIWAKDFERGVGKLCQDRLIGELS